MDRGRARVFLVIGKGRCGSFEALLKMSRPGTIPDLNVPLTGWRNPVGTVQVAWKDDLSELWCYQHWMRANGTLHTVQNR